MLGRRRINSSTQLRSSLSNAALAVEERVVWRGGDALRALAEVVRWPFERAVWAIERGLVWPLEERTGRWNEPLRATGVAALALAAVGAGVLGLVWASGNGGTAQRTQRASAPIVAPAVSSATPKEALPQAAPVLQGAAPDFTPKASGDAGASGGSPAKGPGEAPETSAAATTDTATSSSTGATATAAKVVPAGPAATKVARQFAGAFVLYETGRSDARVRKTFATTATSQLSHSLLRRPPRLPADVKVPKAKVLNLVPGPQHGDTYTLSVSLLRVGVTSELRIDMQRDEKTGEWRVTDVLG
jgi:hypothetical protein